MGGLDEQQWKQYKKHEQEKKTSWIRWGFEMAMRKMSLSFWRNKKVGQSYFMC